MGHEYKDIIFLLINSLTMAHHEPGEKVITEGDTVLDQEGEPLDDKEEKHHVFFIMTGFYVV